MKISAILCIVGMSGYVTMEISRLGFQADERLALPLLSLKRTRPPLALLALHVPVALPFHCLASREDLFRPSVWVLAHRCPHFLPVHQAVTIPRSRHVQFGLSLLVPVVLQFQHDRLRRK
jgi:hypothetical protein